MSMYRKKKRSRKYRGTKTQGYGTRGHRKSGYRGGRGKAGGHKHHWTYIVKYDPDYFGKGRRGIKRPVEVTRKIKTINIDELEEKIDEFLEQKKAKLVGDTIELNLKEIGYDKILGRGKLTRKLVVKAPMFSRIAAEKIEKAGGRIVKLE